MTKDDLNRNVRVFAFVHNLDHELCRPIPKSELVTGNTYRGICRNAEEAVWKGEVFEYIRYKWNNRFPEEINHYEDDNGYDLFVPIEIIEKKTYKKMYRDELKKKKRIGNIQCEPQAGDEKYAYDIVCFYPNSFYGHIQDYKPDPHNPEFYTSDVYPHSYIHKDCFKNPESKYVVAMVTNEEEADVRSVGMRPWELSEQDTADFKKILEYIFANEEEDY